MEKNHTNTLSKTEIKELIELGSGEKLKYDPTQTFLNHFLLQVQLHPDKIAVIDSSSSITYTELNRKSNILAQKLIELGVKSNEFVGLNLARVKEFLIAVIGIWKAGGAYVPLDPLYPQERIEYIKQDSEAKITIDENFLSKIDFSQNEHPVNLSTPDNLAYMIYTSGTTGRPKGVMISHANLEAFLSWIEVKYTFKAEDVMAEYLSFCFSGSIFELYFSLISGKTLHLLSDKLRTDINLLKRYVKDNHISEILLPPQIALEALKGESIELKKIFCGSEKLERIIKTTASFFNCYGMTEFTLFSTFHLVNGEEKCDIPIGRPVPNCIALILNENNQLVKKGEVGELALIGPQLAQGYWKMPELTAQKFIQAPYDLGNKMYKTGDLVRWNEQGELIYLGRVDNQIKIRGFRVEPEEIENTLAKITEIKASVVALKDLNGVQRLVAYYESNKELDSVILRNKLSETLANYMLPDIFIHLDKLPRNSNGKLDRHCLPEPTLKAETHVLPATDFEMEMYKLVAAELGTNIFGVTSNLISMGLTSIKAISLSALIREKTGYIIKTADILATPYIRAWQTLIKNNTENFSPLSPQTTYPLTSNQLGIYIVWDKERFGLQYNLPRVLKLTNIDAKKLLQALDQVIKAHPYLKVHLSINEQGEVVQVRRDTANLTIQFKNLTYEPEKDFFQAKVLPFNLLKDDLARFEIYQTPKATYLFLDIHHIIFDGGSMNILLSDLIKAYNDEKIKEETINAYDYALYYENWQKTEDYLKAENYFSDLLSETESFLYPSINSNSEANHNCKSYEVSFAKENIQSYCQKIGITENTFFATTLCQVFQRISREKTIQIASISNGRSSYEIANSFGMFVQTLPLTCKTFTGKALEVLKNMQEQSIETIKHDKYPYTNLVSQHDLKPNVIFAYQGGVLGQDTVYEKFEQFELNLKTTKFPLAINIYPKENSYMLTFDYDSGLYTEHDIKILANSLKNFAINLVKKDLNTEISSIPLVSQSETEELIKLGTGEKLTYDKMTTFIDLFLVQAKSHPTAKAVVDATSSFSYKELDEKSDILAKKLIEAGVKCNDFVCIQLPRIKEFMLAVIGIWKAGGAYIPIDPAYPEDRIQYMIEDSKAKIVIDKSFLEQIDFSKRSEALNLATPQNKAYMIYTSGSTGKPKGVVISHESERTFIEWISKMLALKCGDNIGEYLSFSFDASTCDLFPSLASGATLHIFSSELKTDLIGLRKYALEQHIKGTALIASLAVEFLAEGEIKLEYLIVGGERIQKVRKGGFKFYNAYGPTEFTNIAAIGLVDQNKQDSLVPIGRPVPNTISVIIDTNGNLVPQGAIGELALIGTQLSQGYWQRPELTNEKFVTVPFLANEKMYRTGDLARWNEKGELIFIGRIDNQVKLRGFRIELGEIENTLKQLAGISSAIAEVKTIGETPHLIGYYVSEHDIAEETIKTELGKYLTNYMVPDYFVRLDQLPRTPNGKIDRKNLPLPENHIKKLPSNDSRTLTYFEEELSKLLTSILKHNDFDIHSDFIELGLTSLSAMKFVALIHKEFNCNLKITDILDKCNILKLENLIQKELLIKKDGKKENTQEVPNQVELNIAQKGIYYETLKNQTSTIYNIPTEIILTSDIDETKLKDCLEHLFKQHRVFNCKIITDEKAYLKYEEEINHTINIKNFTEKDYQAYKKNFVKPFSLSDAPLYRCEIVKTELKTYILFDIHHIIFDGTSLKILLKELKDLYENNSTQEESNTIFNYAQEEISLINSEKYSQAKSFFDEMLRDFETCSELPLDKTNNSKGIQKEVKQHTETEKILAFCKKNNLTPAQFFLSAISYTLSRYVNNKDIFISTISNGRNNPAFSNTLGMFVKTLPFHAKIENGTNVLEYIKQTGVTFRKDIENDIYALTEVNKSYNFVPKIIYVCQLGVLEDNTLKETPIKMQPLVLETPKVPLAISIENEGEKIVIILQYDSNLYLESTIKEFAYSINVAINNFIQKPEDKIEHISLIDDAREEKLKKIRQGKIINIEEQIIHKKFEKAVDLFPNNKALIATDKDYTFKELEENANKIARYLISKGIQIEDKIIFILSRTSKIISTIFGILKAGACYIPCIPDYPKERIDKIVQDSGAKFIICENSNVSLYQNSLDIDEILKFNNTKRPEIAVKPHNLAYMIYTSGTTGKPKGVLIEHKSVANILMDNQANYLAYSMINSEICLALAIIAFDMASTEILTPICNGKTLVFADEEQTHDITKLTELIHKTKPKTILITPSRLQQFIEWPDFCEELKDIKSIICGAEGFPKNLYKKLKDITAAQIINGYGPTENTMYVNSALFSDPDKKITTGKPIPNCHEFIVDIDGNELPIGIMGELYIGGITSARGYQNNQELTDKRFIQFKGERVYKSGDFASWTEDGEISVLGRIDNQIKLRGLRIELDEVNGTILSFENITNSTVLVKKVNNEDNLCAYFTATERIDVDKLKEHLSNILPPYMVPSFMIQLDKFPTNNNGKLNKQALPDFITNEKKELVKATSKAEQDFCNIFSMILKHQAISATDNFFEIGGTSLLVTRIIIEAKKLHYDINYGDVFNAKTPQELAKICNHDTTNKYSSDDEIENFDYTAINNLLSKNTVEHFILGQHYKLKDILLTGATGFLGIHVLYDFLKNETGKIYCLLRKGRFSSVEERLTELLMYYFGENVYLQYKNRIILVEGDITDKSILKTLEKLNINSVFNCAANVKHFSHDDAIKQVNYYGVLNLIELCQTKKIRLIQTSTTSISGFSINNSLPSDTKLDENTLYYNQNLDNKYLRSKFLAERAILNAVANGSLDAKIMRLGNLSSRNTDGEFQINSNTNSFMSRFMAYNKLGCFPYSGVNDAAEFSPIDCVARAIILLSTTPNECTVFHPFNNHNVRTGDIITLMQNNGLKINFVEDEQYAEAIQQKQAENAELLSSIVAYQDIAHGNKIQVIEVLNSYTIQILYRLHYAMPITEENYINKVFDGLIGLGFFY